MSADLAEPPTTERVPVASVVIGQRSRKDLGDLGDLMESIRHHGMLQPIGLAPGNRLLFGGRRLESAKRLGIGEIPVTRPTTQTDALSLLTAERDENTCRKNMTPEELVDLGLRLEELERPEAKERQGARHDLHPTSGSREPEVGWDRDGKVNTGIGKALGMSGSTYFRAKSVVQTARGGGHPHPDVQAAAQAALEQMNAGKTSINGAYNKIRKPGKVAEAPEALYGASPVKRSTAKSARPAVLRKTRRIDSRRVIAATVDSAAANAIGPDLLAEIDLAELETHDLGEWISSLAESIRALTSLKTTLKKELNQRG